IVTSPEKFQQNIKELIFMAKKYTNNIVFLEAIGVDETKVDPIPWARDRSYKNIYIKKYNGIIKKECQKNKVHFIEIFDYWVKSDYKNWLEDGVHPNSMGHKKIFEKVREFLISKKLI
ncbi:MAG: GDSL-type esterase/lipase family protein, partial [Patescibacteria group bacterium]|nr:GDSL-type esterase/lipase family protein [Patescibacteria group bacterium]